MQTAGSEKTKMTQTSDGPTTSADSQPSATAPPEASQLPATTPDEPLPLLSTEFPDNKEGAVKALRWNGLSVARAKRILAAAGGAKYLKEQIMGSVALNFELPSLQFGEKMLRHCSKLIMSKDTSIAEKVKLMKAFPGIQSQIRQTAHAAILAAEKFAPETKPQPQQQQRPVNIGINVSPYPPLAPMPERARAGALSVETDTDDRDRPL